MRILTETTTTATKRSTSYARKKQIQYSCGCRYLFNHQVILDHVCSEHERELIAHHGWDCILKHWNFHILLSYYFLALSFFTDEFLKRGPFFDYQGLYFLVSFFTTIQPQKHFANIFFLRIEKNCRVYIVYVDCRP